MEKNPLIQQTPLRRVFSDGAFIVAFASLTGFIITYRYESAYCDYLGIPTWLITFDLTETLAVIGALATVFWIIFSLFAPFKVSSSSHLLGGIITGLVFFFPIVIIFFSSHVQADWSVYKWPVYIFLLVLFMEFILPLITQWKVKGYSEKIKAHVESEEKGSPVSRYIDLLINKLGRAGFIGTFFLLLLIWYSYYAGLGKALSLTTFDIIETRPPKIVLKSFGNYLICTTLTNDSLKTYSSFQIIDKAALASGNFTISRKKLGKLTYDKKTEELEKTKISTKLTEEVDMSDSLVKHTQQSAKKALDSTNLFPARK
jgi:hypothetical protein